MSEATPEPGLIVSAEKPGWRLWWRRTADGLTVGSAFIGALSMIVLLLGLTGVIVYGAWEAIRSFGLHFFVDWQWNPVRATFGAWPVVYGTVVTAFIALLIAVPVALGSAVFLVRLAPRWLMVPASFLIELLAAIPSIAYGLWGSAILVPLMQDYVHPALATSLGQVPGLGRFFVSGNTGFSILAAGIILAIMVTPIITAITRDVLRTVPPELEQGAYGLGATWWQATKIVLAYARMGIFGAIILGLARALGETMAVTMLIGNTIHRSNDVDKYSLLAPGQTIASLLANQFGEADTDMHKSALIYSALLLLLITALINGVARILIVHVTQNAAKR